MSMNSTNKGGDEASLLSRADIDDEVPIFNPEADPVAGSDFLGIVEIALVQSVYRPNHD